MIIFKPFYMIKEEKEKKLKDLYNKHNRNIHKSFAYFPKEFCESGIFWLETYYYYYAFLKNNGNEIYSCFKVNIRKDAYDANPDLKSRKLIKKWF